MRTLELFSGAGGLAKGLELSGCKHVGFVEWNRDACATLEANFDPSLVYCGDIRDYDMSGASPVDIVAGGPPCQPFSLGGKHKGVDDGRDMFPIAIASIDLLRPKAFIFENVKGLLRESFQDYFEYILLRLKYPSNAKPARESWQQHLRTLRSVSKNGGEEVEYRVTFQLLNAANYGIPQQRERVVIVGVRGDLDIEFKFPSPTHSEAMLLYEQFVSKNYWERNAIEPRDYSFLNNRQRRMVEGLLKSGNMFSIPGSPWMTIRDCLGEIPGPQENHGISDHIFRGGARTYPGHTGSELDLPSKTIKAGGHGVPGGENMIRYPDGTVRYLTVYEAKLLQTFPSDYFISGAWGEAMRQIGNAVPVQLAELIAARLRVQLAHGSRNQMSHAVA